MITREDFEINMRGCDLMSKLFAEQLLKERDAYREIAVQFFKATSMGANAAALADAEAQRILEAKKEGV